ncbi:hypothetical protein ABZP36_025786 [Zizania latifolia]
MAGRLLANLIVMGGSVVGRAMLQAYRQAIVNANKTGAAQEAIHGIRRVSKAMTEQEARQILGISEQSTWEEISQVCDNMLSLILYIPAGGVLFFLCQLHSKFQSRLLISHGTLHYPKTIIKLLSC